MYSLTKLAALLLISGTLCLSSLGNATPDNAVKEVHSAGDHELSGAKPSSSIHNKVSGDEDHQWDKKFTDRKVVLNEQSSHPKPMPASVYLNDNSASSVPEPEIYAMLVAGLSLLGYIARRKKSVT